MQQYRNHVQILAERYRWDPEMIGRMPIMTRVDYVERAMKSYEAEENAREGNSR